MAGGVSRIGTWNLGRADREQAATLVAAAGLDLLLLQDAPVQHLASFARAAGFDWACSAADLQVQPPRSRWRSGAAAIAGRGTPPRARRLFTDVPHPLRMVLVELGTPWGPLTAVAYNTSRGLMSRQEELAHSLVLARWLEKVTGTVVVGTSTLGPKTDHPDLGSLKTQQPTGSAGLETGEPGDDLMFGARPIHQLDDALRRWFDTHPDELDHERRLRPDGPLAVTYMTRPVAGRDGQPHRRDALWITRDLEVVHRPDHDYEGAVRAGGDHALVIADLTRTLSR